MIEADHHPLLHVDFGKFWPKLASYVVYIFTQIIVSLHLYTRSVMGVAKQKIENSIRFSPTEFTYTQIY